MKNIVSKEHKTLSRDRRQGTQSRGFSSPYSRKTKGIHTDATKKAGGPNLQNTPTPPSLCRWIYERLSNANVSPQKILDPGAGQGNLTHPFRPRSKVIEYEIEHGKDFFTAKRKISCDLVMCNPPWSGVVQWLRHVVKLVGNRTPIVFFSPMAIVSGYKTGPFRKYLESPEAPILNHITPLPTDTFVRVYCASAILWFNLPKLQNVALVPSEYLIRRND
jgi:hypothetical protein